MPCDVRELPPLDLSAVGAGQRIFWRVARDKTLSFRDLTFPRLHPDGWGLSLGDSHFCSSRISCKAALESTSSKTSKAGPDLSPTRIKEFAHNASIMSGFTPAASICLPNGSSATLDESQIMRSRMPSTGPADACTPLSEVDGSKPSPSAFQPSMIFRRRLPFSAAVGSVAPITSVRNLLHGTADSSNSATIHATETPGATNFSRIEP
mmetsp:Transcript_44036/g.70678  ORF Transcript_44036/g.70678 Transcript_44036/m.70678 type:complete len:208 (-) Transcript_44036:675-1298(-)